MVRDFLAKEVVPHYAEWEKDGIVDRAVWLKAGEQGLLGLAVPEEYGGGGVDRLPLQRRPRRGGHAGSGRAGSASRCTTTSSART